MSYEGYEEYICVNGHYWAADALSLIHSTNAEKRSALVCPHCKKQAQYTCSVDQTNGMDENEPWSLSGPKTDVGFDDLPREDHHGNKYFVKLPRYAPDLTSGRWRTF
jgi:hypothetical protein